MNTLSIRQRPGVETFRFWQEGPGYDRNFDRTGTVLTAIDYIHMNPVRRGLAVQAVDRQWSSDRWFAEMAYDSKLLLLTLTKLPAEFLDERAS